MIPTPHNGISRAMRSVARQKLATSKHSHSFNDHNLNLCRFHTLKSQLQRLPTNVS